MELFILIISVPLFLIIVLLISVFVLANYSGTEPTKAAMDVKTSDTTDTTEGADSLAT